jgi:hypothetical protein
VIVSYNSRASSHSVLHHTPTVSVANDPYRFEAGYCLYLFADFRSRRLIDASKKLVNRSQKIIDDETAKRFEQASARRKRNERLR